MKKNLKILVVEGNIVEENINFKKAGCTSQSENFSQHVKMLEPNSEIDIVEPGNDSSISKIISSLNKYNGIILTGSTLRVNDNSSEIKKHIEFAKTCFQYNKNFFAACWGLQVTVTAAGGKCRVAPKGPHIGIAYDIELTEKGKKHKLYSSKPNKFTSPGFNFDEVEIPPNNSVLLATDKINKFQALHFKVGNSEIWGLKHRKQRLLNIKSFKNEKEIHQHIALIEQEKNKLTDEMRTLELKNWLRYLKESN